MPSNRTTGSRARGEATEETGGVTGETGEVTGETDEVTGEAGAIGEDFPEIGEVQEIGLAEAVPAAARRLRKSVIDSTTRWPGGTWNV